MIKLIRKFIAGSTKRLCDFDSEINELKSEQAKEHDQRNRELLKEFNSKHKTNLSSLEQVKPYLQQQDTYLTVQKLLADMEKHTEFLKNT